MHRKHNLEGPQQASEQRPRSIRRLLRWFLCYGGPHEESDTVREREIELAVDALQNSTTAEREAAQQAARTALRAIEERSGRQRPDPER